MSVNPALLSVASSMPGLQNLGTASGSAQMTGNLPISGYLTFADPAIIDFPVGVPTDVIAMTRINITGSGTPSSISSVWFPLIGSTVIYDGTNRYYIVVYATSNAAGRAVYTTLLNNKTNNSTEVSGLTVNVFCHLYSYPF